MLYDVLTYAVIKIACNVTGNSVIDECGKATGIKKRAH